MVYAANHGDIIRPCERDLERLLICSAMTVSDGDRDVNNLLLIVRQMVVSPVARVKTVATISVYG